MLKYNWTRIKNDVNGNPRYVVHFLDLDIHGPYEGVGYGLSERYAMACKLANTIGGRKYHNKSYGGGIVFQSYSLAQTEDAIDRALAKARAAEKCANDGSSGCAIR